MITTFEVHINRTGGQLLISEEEEQCMAMQGRVGKRRRRDDTNTGKPQENGNNANDVFDDMG